MSRILSKAVAKAPPVRKPILMVISAPHLKSERGCKWEFDHSLKSRGCSPTLRFRTVSNSATNTLSLASESKIFLGESSSDWSVSLFVSTQNRRDWTSGAHRSAVFKLAVTATWATAACTFTNYFPQPGPEHCQDWGLLRVSKERDSTQIIRESVHLWKHCKNWKCRPVSLLIVRSQGLSWYQVLNCQNCFKCHKSLELSLDSVWTAKNRHGQVVDH